MNDSLLYFLLYTAGCLVMGFSIGGVWEARRNLGKLDALKISFDQKFDELTKLSDRRVAAVENYYEKRLADANKCSHCCDDCSYIEHRNAV